MARLSFDIAENLAQKFRSENGIGETEMIDTISILRKLNIFSLFRPLSEKFSGMSLLSPSGLKFILINSEKPIGRQHFSTAHEIYHLLYDDDPMPHICTKEDDKKNISEVNANIFAAALLMPYKGLIQYLSKEELKERKLLIPSMLKLEQYYRVSRSALLVRLKTCKLISEQQYQYLCKLPISELAREYGQNTALYNKGNKNLVVGDLGEKARILYEKETISESHYRMLLNLIAYDQD